MHKSQLSNVSNCSVIGNYEVFFKDTETYFNAFRILTMLLLTLILLGAVDSTVGHNNTCCPDGWVSAEYFDMGMTKDD